MGIRLIRGGEENKEKEHKKEVDGQMKAGDRRDRMNIGTVVDINNGLWKTFLFFFSVSFKNQLSNELVKWYIAWSQDDKLLLQNRALLQGLCKKFFLRE